MIINWKKLKVAKPEDPIYKEGFKIYPINSLNDYKKQREKEGMKNIFFNKVDNNFFDLPREQQLKKLVKILEEQGFKLKK